MNLFSLHAHVSVSVYLCVYSQWVYTCVSTVSECIPVCLQSVSVYLSVYSQWVYTCVSTVSECIPVCLQSVSVYLCVYSQAWKQAFNHPSIHLTIYPPQREKKTGVSMFHHLMCSSCNCFFSFCFDYFLILWTICTCVNVFIFKYL